MGRIPVPPDRRVLDASEFTQRLGHEVERAKRYDRSLAVLIVLFGDIPPPVRRSAVEQVLMAVRNVDIVGRDDPSDSVAVILPETGTGAHVAARRLLFALAPIAASARVGIALCPADALGGNDLITCARGAALAAPLGTVAGAQQNVPPVRVGSHTVVACDPRMTELLELARRLAPSDLPVLITGETGVGKDVIASAIHDWSLRSSRKLVTVNCAALTESLLESELFGHERGAFTGANETKVGLMEVASGGTLFLDEICEASHRTQAELLRVLETGKIRRVGGVAEREIDVRIVTATNRDPQEQIDSGQFRRDLFYRLSGASLVIPSLRERGLDIPVMARHFLEQACTKAGRGSIDIGEGAMKRLLMHDWPGNVREMKNLMEYLAVTVSGNHLDAAFLPERIAADVAPWLKASPVLSRDSSPPASLPGTPVAFRRLTDEIEELERTRMEQALRAAGGIRVRAAQLIGMPIRTFLTKMKKYGLDSIESPRHRAAREKG